MERKGRKDRKARLFFASFAVFAFFVPRAVQPFRAASRPQADDVKARLVGSWTLVKYEVFGANGEVRPGNYDVGRLRYDAQGEMDAHLMRSREHAYLGYFGPYTIDAQKRIVVHHVAGSSLQNWIGTDQVRYYGFSTDGNQLTLSLKSGERVTQMLTWDRLR
jgi:hypothetical protein